MKPTHLLDTDVVIQALRRRDHTVRRRLEALDRPPAVSSVTAMELWCGVARSTDPQGNAAALTEFLAFVDPTSFGTGAAETAGRLRAELAERGTPIGAYDVLIAGHALSEGLVLASRNVREFRRVRGLEVENWSH